MRVFGVRWFGLICKVDGIGWVMRECREDVLLGMTREWSICSPVEGLLARSLVEGRINDEWLRSEGILVVTLQLSRPSEYVDCFTRPFDGSTREVLVWPEPETGGKEVYSTILVSQTREAHQVSLVSRHVGKHEKYAAAWWWCRILLVKVIMNDDHKIIRTITNSQCLTRSCSDESNMEQRTRGVKKVIIKKRV